MDIFNLNTSNDNFFDNDYFIINLRVKQRNARKYITTIENIPHKYLDDKEKLDQFLIKLRNKISSRATFKEENGLKFIEVSGNKTDIMVGLLEEYLNCTTDCIKVHGV
jgi:translation initiation factor 1 (eIF-1/SUI1)